MNNNQTDVNDTRAAAVAALLLARDLATDFRTKLPSLLGQRAPSGLGDIATKFESGRLFEASTISSLEGLLAQCDAKVQDGTTRRTTWVVARHIGGDEVLEAVEVDFHSPDADELSRIAARIAELVRLIKRYDALKAADIFLASQE